MNRSTQLFSTLSSKLKWIIFLFLPVIGFSQGKLDTLKLLDNKLTLLAPHELSPMTDKIWDIKYPGKARPDLVLTDGDAEVNLIANKTNAPATETQMASFKTFQLTELKKKRADLTVLEEGVKQVHGKNVGYIKFLTQAIDQKVFNYYFFIIVDGRILFFTFNCIEKLQSTWEKTADNIVASLKTN